jgi:hypothetical protein
MNSNDAKIMLKYGPNGRRRSARPLKILLDEAKVRECLLLLGAESFVFQVAIQKLKD